MSELEQFKRWAASVDMPDAVLPRAWMAWQASADRAQPAQAGHVPEASCGECGKKASDGWALYCVACMEKAGLPAVTDSPPLTHSCTSSLGKTPDSTAQAGQVLTLDEVRESVHEAGLDWHNGWTMGEDAENRYLNLCRAIEQAVLAKRVPMPPEDWHIFNTGAEVASGLTWAEAWDYMTPSRIERGWTAVCVANKSNIGIVGKEGV